MSEINNWFISASPNQAKDNTGTKNDLDRAVLSLLLDSVKTGEVLTGWRRDMVGGWIQENHDLLVTSTPAQLAKYVKGK